jgi:hypothetical protein
MIRLARADFGFFMVENLDDSGTVAADILVQTDYDYPGIAGTFGWSVRMVEGRSGLRNVRCHHDGTDGTIACNAGNPYASCGLTAADFIASAAEYLDAHIGATADDPGYFA